MRAGIGSRRRYGIFVSRRRCPCVVRGHVVGGTVVHGPYFRGQAMYPAHRAIHAGTRGGRDSERLRLCAGNGGPGTVKRPLAGHHATGASIVRDVGANIGQCGDALLREGFNGTLVSFEAIPDVHGQLLEHAKRRSRSWLVAPCAALGSSNGQIEINIGYEMEVLKGATGLLGRTVALQLELSLAPLYDGAPTIAEVISFGGDLIRRGQRFRIIQSHSRFSG